MPDLLAKNSVQRRDRSVPLHADWNGVKGHVVMTAADCILGIALTKAADDENPRAAYGDFAAEARALVPAYAPKTVNADGWTATRNAFLAWFPTIVMILCFLHGFLKIRDLCRKNRDLNQRIWEMYWAETASLFRTRMEAFRQGFESQSWTPPMREMAAKL